jgi:predicted NBD/HSP70 family sugar kinase
MILGVDIGGTKTLFVVFNNYGEIVSTKRIETPQKYSDFLQNFKNIYMNL